MSSRTKALLAIIFVSLLWSTAPASAKILLRTFSPFSLQFLRLLIASIVLFPLFLRYNKTPFKKLFVDVAPISLLNAINFLVFILGIGRTTGNATAIIYTATPLTALLLSHWLINERSSPRKITGILIGLTGMIVILLLPLLERGSAFSGDIIGNSLMVIGMISWSAGIVGSRHIIVNKKYSPVVTTFMTLIVSCIVLGVATVATASFSFPVLTPIIIGLFLYLTIGVTIVTYVLHQWAIKHTTATTASLTNYLQPVFGVVVNWILLGEKLTPGFIAGALLVFGGVFVATGNNFKRWISGQAWNDKKTIS